MQNLWLLSMSSSWGKKLPLPTLTNPWLSKLFRYHSKVNFFLLPDTTDDYFFSIQLTRDRPVWSMSKEIIRSLVSGVSVNIVKPLLFGEVRRIMPTAAGLPLELSLLTAAVTAANVRGKQQPRLLNLSLEQCSYGLRTGTMRQM